MQKHHNVVLHFANQVSLMHMQQHRLKNEGNPRVCGPTKSEQFLKNCWTSYYCRAMILGEWLVLLHKEF